jgi:hypothetical protein
MEDISYFLYVVPLMNGVDGFVLRDYQNDGSVAKLTVHVVEADHGIIFFPGVEKGMPVTVTLTGEGGRIREFVCDYGPATRHVSYHRKNNELLQIECVLRKEGKVLTEAKYDFEYYQRDLPFNDATFGLAQFGLNEQGVHIPAIWLVSLIIAVLFISVACWKCRRAIRYP